MSTLTGSAATRYDRALLYTHDGRLPPGFAELQPTSAWPPENVALLEQYRDWLLSSGLSLNVINILYIPTAGYALGLSLRPHPQLDLDADLGRALVYVQAKRLSTVWTKNSRNALDKFRLFLRQQRGQWTLELPPPPERSGHAEGLPAWVREPLERFYHLRRSQWRPARSNVQHLSFWNSYTLVWRWLLAHYPITGLLDIKRQYLLDYVDYGLTQGHAASTINNALRCFHAFLLYLQDQDYRVPQALLRLPILKEPDRLPRFLTDEQVRALRDDFEQRVSAARFAVQRRDALLDRAAFYLLWHGGLRLGEVEELRLEDLDFAEKRLMVRQGKGQKDRAVYVTNTAMQAILAYLPVRGAGPDDHLLLYHHRPVCKDLIRERLKAAGRRCGVYATPHRLRHTCATQLLNAGCRITSIQKLLGHREMSSTLIYAQVHDHTVSADYYAAMSRIEKALALSPTTDTTERLPAAKHARLLALADRLAEPQLDLERRLSLVEQLRGVLVGETDSG